MNFDNKLVVNGENVFRVYADSFWIPPTTSGYTLKFSGDSVNWIEDTEAVAANESKLVKGFPSGLFFKLESNADSLIIKF